MTNPEGLFNFYKIRRSELEAGISQYKEFDAFWCSIVEHLIRKNVKCISGAAYLLLTVSGIAYCIHGRRSTFLRSEEE